MQETLFTKIIRGDIPCHKVYEDERVFAFLDINPLAPGHTLVIPKEPAASLDQLSAASSAAIGKVLPMLCRAVMQASGVSNYNILQNNGHAAHQAVMHVHFHIIPKPSADTGLGVGWPAKSLDAAQGAQMAQRIITALRGN